jgi:hypothetical protein
MELAEDKVMLIFNPARPSWRIRKVANGEELPAAEKNSTVDASFVFTTPEEGTFSHVLGLETSWGEDSGE